MSKLSKEHIRALICGSSIFGTGGGFHAEVQEQAFAALLSEGYTPELLSLSELPEDAYVCAAYGIGPAGAATTLSDPALKKALLALESEIGGKIAAIFPGETGIESFVFQIAAHLNLPVADADGTGGRAVPEIQIDNFVLHERSSLPLIAVTSNAEVTIVDNAPSLHAVETEVRNLAIESADGVLCIFDHAVPVSEAKKLLTGEVMKRAISVGEEVLDASTFDEKTRNLVHSTNGSVCCTGEVVESTLDTHSGFLQGSYLVKETVTGRECRVHVKNENIALTVNGQVIASAPDLIAVLERSSGYGLHTSQVSLGQQVAVVNIPASSLWASQAGRELFSPKALGLNLVDLSL